MQDIWANFGRLYRVNCVWLKDFQFFGDKSGAINLDAGVSDKLSAMLQRWCNPGQKLAVGKPKYKTIIEACLGIPCLYDEVVMEVMWGIKNLSRSLVPEEKLPLAKGDRLQMSLGLKMLLNRYGFDVKPEMISDHIIVVACALHDCDDCDKKVSGPLRRAGNILKDVSHINCDDWGLLKLGTAMKMLTFPEKNVVGNPQEMFSADELSKLINDAPKYKDKLKRYDCLRAYNLVVSSHKIRTAKHELLGSLIKEAERACQDGQDDGLRSWGLDEPLTCGDERPSKKRWGLDEPSCGKGRPSKRLRSHN